MEELIILVVDDGQYVRRSICRILGKSFPNSTLIGTTDGAKALDVVIKWSGKIDLILCDVEMPVMAGDEFLKEVFAHYPELQDRVLVTGNTSGRPFFDSVTLRSIKKPFNTNQLLREIEELLSKAC